MSAKIRAAGRVAEYFIFFWLCTRFHMIASVARVSFFILKPPIISSMQYSLYTLRMYMYRTTSDHICKNSCSTVCYESGLTLLVITVINRMFCWQISPIDVRTQNHLVYFIMSVICGCEGYNRWPAYYCVYFY